MERHEQECVVSPIGAANAVKRKYAELVSGDDEMREKDVATLTLEVFDMVCEAAQKKIRKGEESRSLGGTTDSVTERVCCETCGAPYGNRESLKRHIRKKHPRSGEAIIASGSGNETLEINAQ